MRYWPGHTPGGGGWEVGYEEVENRRVSFGACGPGREAGG